MRFLPCLLLIGSALAQRPAAASTGGQAPGVHSDDGLGFIPATQPIKATQTVPNVSNSRLAALEKRTAKLENQITGLLDLIEFLRSELTKNNDARLAEIEKQIELSSGDFGILDASNQKYTDLRADNGLTFFLSVVSVQPYLDGFKIDMKIGNPNFATVYGCTIKIGPSNPDGTSANMIAIDVPQTLASGAWTRTDLFMPNVTAAQMRKLRVSMSASTIGLN